MLSLSRSRCLLCVILYRSTPLTWMEGEWVTLYTSCRTALCSAARPSHVPRLFVEVPHFDEPCAGPPSPNNPTQTPREYSHPDTYSLPHLRPFKRDRGRKCRTASLLPTVERTPFHVDPTQIYRGTMDAMDGPAWSNTHLPANGGGGSIEGVGIGISIPAGSASASHHINSLGGGHGPGNVPVAATTLTGTAQTSSTNKQGQSSSELASETKRTKRRYDMVERVERLRRDTIDRKDSIYADLQQSFTLSLNAILHQPYPTHPEYLLRLHALSVQRDAELLASRLESTYAIETARQLYHNEVERIQEEFEAAKKAVKEKLLEACDERAKKLREEKDNLELTGLGLDSLFGEYGGLHGKHATRRRGGGLAGGSHHQHILSTMTSILNNTGSVGGANSASATQPASTGGALGNAPMTAPEASSSSGPAQPGKLAESHGLLQERTMFRLEDHRVILMPLPESDNCNPTICTRLELPSSLLQFNF